MLEPIVNLGADTRVSTGKIVQEDDPDVLHDDNHSPDRQRPSLSQRVEENLSCPISTRKEDVHLVQLTVAMGCPIGLLKILSVSVPMKKARTMLRARGHRCVGQS